MSASIHVTGLKELQKGLNSLEEKLGPELKRGLDVIAGKVVTVAQSKTARRSGKAASSIKAGSSQRAAVIKVGGQKAPYFPWLEWGGRVGRRKQVKRPFIPEGRTIYPTAADKREELVHDLDELIVRLAGQAGFTASGDGS